MTWLLSYFDNHSIQEVGLLSVSCVAPNSYSMYRELLIMTDMRKLLEHVNYLHRSVCYVLIYPNC